ncbi:MAG: hypothetical protein IJX39_00430 [Clostridia bacterium]|nr:hypothetical protein [Clostridia bacterium]
MSFLKNGAQYISALIGEAVKNGSREATVSGDYEIESCILIPSDFTLYLKNCHLVMADNTFCNMFSNENCRKEIGRTRSGTDRNIRIIGQGRAILDGGAYNGLSEKNQNTNGLPAIYENNVILFTNVDGFEVRGLHIRNQRWWATNFVYCANGKITDMDFCSDPTAVLPDGSTRPYLLRDEYAATLVKNSDGIDIRVGCHDILIENVTGFTEDDTVALTALNGGLEKRFYLDGASMDIRNIVVRNVVSSAYCSNVRLLCAGGDIRMYNILVDGMMDASADCPYLDHGRHGVRLGDAGVYGDRIPTPDSMFNITVRNVFSRAISAIKYHGEIGNLTLDNINGFDGCETVIDHIKE